MKTRSRLRQDVRLHIRTGFFFSFHVYVASYFFSRCSSATPTHATEILLCITFTGTNTRRTPTQALLFRIFLVRGQDGTTRGACD